MKKLALSIFLICTALTTTAQTMHTLIFVNESEPGRQVDRTADSKNM